MKWSLFFRILTPTFRRATSLFLSLLLYAASAWAGPKIVVFTATYGAGHDAAAKQIVAAIKKENPDAEVVVKNMQDFMSDFVRKKTTKGFDDAQSRPGMYDLGFELYLQMGKLANHVGQMPMGYAIKMKEFSTWLSAQHPDSIICTWPHALEVIARARRKGMFQDLAVGWVHTDNVSNGGKSFGYFEKLAMEADMAFLPSVPIDQKFGTAGVPTDRKMVSGMPVNVTPRPPLTDEQRLARRLEARQKLGLDPTRKTMMIEAGKNGIGNYPAMIGSIVQAFPGENISIVAATGTNAEQLEQVQWLTQGVGKDAQKTKTLYSRLKVLKKEGVTEKQIRSWIRDGLSKDSVDVRAFGFIPLADWRLASDAIGTKPGGLSTSEMGSEGQLMILRAGMASGQELYNVDNFVEQNLAVKNLKESAIGSEFKSLLENPELIARIHASSEEFRKNIRTEEIAKWALNVAQTHSDHPGVPLPRFSSRDCLRTILKNILLK